MNAFSIDRQDGIARLVLDLPGEPVNKLSKTVRDELESILPDLAKDSDVRAVVLLSGKSDNFIAGADIDEFVALESHEEALSLVQTGQELVNRFADIGKPVVAAIHGPCLGGGLETALACSYRVATNHPKTSLGLPEVQLGILPAARHPPRRWRMSAPPPSHWSPGGAGNYSGGEDGSRQACAPNGDR
jgi:3-hydroxyacyl-CoA dehydrogenase/enoyl-CoA hydratase/3-hydroxybutyryl-CoA epimerase